MREWDRVFDVLVIGSGAAGLSAAISAQHKGASVLVVERTDKIGGTTAVSGGVAWIPNNHRMHEVGGIDSREMAITYLKSLSLGRIDMGLAETYVDEGPKIVRYLETETPLEFRALTFPDYHPEHPGGTFGRSLSPALFAIAQIGELKRQLRSAPMFPFPMSWTDLDDGIDMLDPDVTRDRVTSGLVGMGNALIAGLIKGAVDKGVEFRPNTRVSRLVTADGRVIGAECNYKDATVRLGARKAVILASGGFEWNKNLVRDLMRGPIEAPLSPPFNEGDGLLMAMEVGAAIANTSEGWWAPSVKIPGEEYENHELGRYTATERSYPRSIMVNSTGNRFVNEAQNYDDVGRMLTNFDAMACGYQNLPAWIILDSGFLDRYPFATRYPGDPVPRWLISAPSIGALAKKVGIDSESLEATIERFNVNAEHGKDPDFKRGESKYDGFFADRSKANAYSTLGPLNQPPYYACRVYAGVLGTRGGAKINARAKVLNFQGEGLPGLYAAGNVSAGLSGIGYPGAGATIGPALVFGHIAGREAASEDNHL